MTEFDIRRPLPTEAEAAQIQDVFYYGWLTTYPNAAYNISRADIEEYYQDRHSTESIASLIKRLREPQAGESFLVATVSGTIVGLCRMSHTAETNRLNALYVIPEHQRQGIGFALAYQSLLIHKEALPTVVHVATYNQGAIAFYTRLGFKHTGVEIHDPACTLLNGAIIPEFEMILAPRPAPP